MIKWKMFDAKPSLTIPARVAETESTGVIDFTRLTQPVSAQTLDSGIKMIIHHIHPDDRWHVTDYSLTIIAGNEPVCVRVNSIREAMDVAEQLINDMWRKFNE